MSLRALVTNDDGIDSEGLRQLALAAVACGLDVTVAAPQHESSGTSAALTAVQNEGRIVVAERQLEGLAGVPARAVEAAPGFIVRIAARGGFGPPPDIVLSGVNRGANTGRAIVHSGTVGAAISAFTLGLRGLAVSLSGGDPEHWETARALAEKVIPMFISVAAPVVLNLNVPDVGEDAVRGLVRARLARFGVVQTTVVETGRGYVKMGVQETGHEPEPDSDVALLAAGYATVTALEPSCERSDVPLPELEEAAQTAG
jgi:5'-nucleotidase